MARTIHSTTYHSKQICNYYYSVSRNGTEWRCRKCEQVKSKNGGWTNLLSHLKSCVGKDFALQYAEHADATRVQQQHAASLAGTIVDVDSSPVATTMHSFVLRLSDAEKEMAEWISYLVERNQPISLVDCPATRRLARLKPMSSKSVRKHILSLMTVVRENIKHHLPVKFALIFDGWTEGTDHYIGIWASYNKTVGCEDGKEHPVQTLLSIRPLLADGIEGMTAQDHLSHINRILDGYGKNKTNVVCLVGDNCNVNQSIARTMEVPLIGCGSHKFNLAVRKWIDDQPELKAIIAKVNSLVDCNCNDNCTHLLVTSLLCRSQL
jgi:BED zinc finger